MTKFSDVPAPSHLIVEGSAPSSPSAGNQRVYIDSADHKIKRKNSGGTVTVIEGGGIESGTSFPVSPSTNDLYQRTDIYNWVFAYDGTRWRTVHTESLDFSMQDAAVNAGLANGSVNAGRARVPYRGVYTLYITDWEVTVTLPAGTNDGSNYSSFKLNYGDSADSDTQVGSTLDTSALSASSVTNLRAAINAVLSTNARWFKCRKDNGAGTPGNGIFVVAGLHYQIIAT